MNLQLLRKKACAVLVCLLTAGILHAQTPDVNEGVIRIKLKPTLQQAVSQQTFQVKNGVVQTGISPLDAIAVQLGAYSMERVFPQDARFESRHAKHGLDCWYEVRFSPQTPVAAALSRYQQVADIERAEYSLKVSLIGDQSPQKVYTAAELVNDPHFQRQWHYSNQGGSPVSIAGADINLPAAWQVTQGKPGVIVSIVDGGIDPVHDDLRPNLWVNEAELNGLPGVDDDGNGYIDDIYGYNFVEQGGKITGHAHGTHVAGTVGAVNNNNIGVSGVAGGSGKGDGVRLMSCQVFSNSGLSGQFARAIVYGADNGAVISQNSWGYDNPESYEQVVLDAIDYFIEEAGRYEGSPMKGGVVICAAGNSASQYKHYPAAYAPVVSVAAMGPCFKVTSYSNYGDWVTLTAPGGESGYGSTWGVFSTYTDNKYAYMDGTSMACPHVSGIAALIVSKYGDGNLTAAEVKQRLITGTHSLDAYNPDYVGKLGSGYIDAALTLKENGHLAPETVSDLTIAGMSQDFAQLRWTAVADADDQQAYTYQLYYLAKPFDAATLSQAKKVEVSSKAVDAGTPMGYTLEKLDPMTMYYFAMMAFDRWGNASALSPVVSGKTNAGPEVVLSGQTLSLTSDVAQNSTPSGSFELINDGEGILDWRAFIRHKSNQFTLYADAPRPEVTPAGIRRASVGKYPVEKAAEKIPSGKTVTDSKSIRYGESMNFVIGETDTTRTQIAATYFFTQTGFNLTAVNFLLRHNKLSRPFTLQIMKSNVFARENVIYEQQVTSFSSDAYLHYINLDEQIYMPAGSAFWVNIIMPSGTLYPFGLATETGYQYSDYCFYSADGGKTMQKLQEAIKDGFSNPEIYVWDIELVSSNGWFGDYLTLSPTEGKVTGNNRADIGVQADAAALLNGTYTANVVIETNDPAKKEVRQPVKLTVSGQKPNVTGAKVVNFSDVFLGEYKLIEVEIANIGLGSFSSVSTKSSNPAFEVVSPVYNLLGQSSASMKIRFRPQQEGSQSSLITLSSPSGYSYQFSVSGIGVSGGKMSLTPSTIELPATDASQPLQQEISLTLSNTGKYPLEYAIGTFAGPLTGSLADVTVNKCGYQLTHNRAADPIAYAWDDISATGTDIKPILVNNQFHKVALGFGFPYFGEVLDSLYITNTGMLVDNDQLSLTACYPPAPDNSCFLGSSVFSLCGVQLKFSGSSHVYYQSENDRFILTYEKVGMPFASGTFTAQLVLHVNGDVEFRYQEMNAELANAKNNYFIGMTTRTTLDPVIINDAGHVFNPDKTEWTEELTDRTIFRVQSPGAQIVEQVSHPAGMLQIGGQQTCTLKINVADLPEGDYYQNLAIITSDPQTPVTYLTLQGTISGGGTPSVRLLTDMANDLGAVYRTEKLSGFALLENTGTSEATVEVSVKYGKVTLPESSRSFTIAPKRSYRVVYECDTREAGVMESILQINTGNSQWPLGIRYTVTPEPVFGCVTESIDLTLAGGTAEEHPVTVHNTGESDMELSFIGSDLVYHPIGDLQQGEKISYLVKRNDEDTAPIYKWEDHQSEATHFPIAYFINKTINNVSVDLPWEFSFYGNKYSRMHLHMGGMISFDPYPEEDQNMEILMPLPTVGDQDAYNNIIAPMLGVHLPFFMAEASQTGIFYYQSDEFVSVEWANYVDWWGIGDLYSFQALLYKNGNIKFQYKNAQSAMWTTFTSGIENQDASHAIQLHNGTDMVATEMAALMSPIKTETVKAGQSRTFDLRVDASTLNKGSYASSVAFRSNAPAMAEYPIPVNLTVTGEPLLTAPQSAPFGERMITWRDAAYDPDQMDPYAAYPSLRVALKNDGYDQFVITDLSAAYSGSFQFLTKVLIDGWMGPVEMEMPLSDLEGYFGENPLTIMPGTKQEIRVILTGTQSGMAEDILTVHTTAGNLSIPVSAHLLEPPYASVGASDLHVIARSENHTEQKQVAVGNGEAGSSLQYSAYLEFERLAGQRTAAVSAPVAKRSVATPVLINDTLSQRALAPRQPDTSFKPVNQLLDAPYGFNRMIAYFPENTSAVNSLGFGATNAFNVAVSFVAPATGFNLSHIRTWYTPGTSLTSTINAYVLAGDEVPDPTRILASGRLVVEIDDSDKAGRYRVVALDQPLHLYPNEKFFIMLSYELGVSNPQGHAYLSTPSDVVNKRYFYSGLDGWYDLADDQSFSMATFLVGGLEKTAENNYWVELSATEGTVEAGSQKQIGLTYHAAQAQAADNRASLVILTNDPANDTIRIPVSMRMNQGPVFDIKRTHHVEENQLLEVSFAVRDDESDPYTVTFEAPEFISLQRNDDAFVLTATPGYDDQGIHHVELTATDSYGAQTLNTILIEVIDVNRAPKALAFESFTLEAGQLSKELRLPEYFHDEDGDALSFVVENQTPSLVRVFVADNSLMISALQPGEAKVKVIATDTHKASADNLLSVSVVTASGLSTASAGAVRIHPNPVTTTAHLVLDDRYAGEVAYRIFTASGALMLDGTFPAASPMIDVAALPAGVYQLVIHTDSCQDVVKLIKE